MNFEIQFETTDKQRNFTATGDPVFFSVNRISKRSIEIRLIIDPIPDEKRVTAVTSINLVFPNGKLTMGKVLQSEIKTFEGDETEILAILEI